MPVSIRKLPGKSRYRVSTPNEVHAKSTTKFKAKEQAKLLNAVDRGWTPTGKKSHAESLAPTLVATLLEEVEAEGQLSLEERLTAAKRRSIPKGKFARPKDRGYPVDTRKRAANALARSSGKPIHAAVVRKVKRLGYDFPSLHKGKK